jgi:uncharacterized protein
MPQHLPVLSSRFEPPDQYHQHTANGYSLLPLRFLPLDDNRYVVTNFAGEHLVLPKDLLQRLVRHELSSTESVYEDLQAQHFLIDEGSTVALDLLATKYRTKQAVLSDFTSLFLFVTTLRCDHSCPYCQVSRQSQDRGTYDMSEETAKKAIDFMFATPSQRN